MLLRQPTAGCPDDHAGNQSNSPGGTAAFLVIPAQPLFPPGIVRLEFFNIQCERRTSIVSQKPERIDTLYDEVSHA